MHSNNLSGRVPVCSEYFEAELNEQPETAAEKPQLRTNRLLELDVLRGIAAIAVLACHYISECQQLGRVNFDFRIGSYGPHLFFIISGFVIFMTLERCKRPGDFLFSRFSRLYPVYWFGVVVSATVMVLAPSYFDNAPSPLQLLGNLTMCQTWLKIPDIEVSYWTLGVELKFYLLMFGLLLFRKLEWIEPFIVVWLAIVSLFRCADAAFGLPHALATPLILGYAHLFAAGIMFYRIRTRGHSWLRHTVIFAAVPMQFWAEGLESMLVVSGCVATIYLFNANKLRWIVNRPLTFLGTISYPLYLAHGAVGVATIQYLNQYELPVVVLLLIPTAVAISLGAALTFHFEKPMLRILRTWYGRSRTAPSMKACNGAR